MTRPVPTQWTHIVVNYYGPLTAQGIQVFYNGYPVRLHYYYPTITISTITIPLLRASSWAGNPGLLQWIPGKVLLSLVVQAHLFYSFSPDRTSRFLGDNLNNNSSCQIYNTGGTLWVLAHHILLFPQVPFVTWLTEYSRCTRP